MRKVPGAFTRTAAWCPTSQHSCVTGLREGARPPWRWHAAGAEVSGNAVELACGAAIGSTAKRSTTEIIWFIIVIVFVIGQGIGCIQAYQEVTIERSP